MKTSRPTMTAEQFEAWREARGLSRPQLAEELGIAVRTIFNYENGVRPVKAIVINRLKELERKHKPVEKVE